MLIFYLLLSQASNSFYITNHCPSSHEELIFSLYKCAIFELSDEIFKDLKNIRRSFSDKFILKQHFQKDNPSKVKKSNSRTIKRSFFGCLKASDDKEAEFVENGLKIDKTQTLERIHLQSVSGKNDWIIFNFITDKITDLLIQKLSLKCEFVLTKPEIYLINNFKYFVLGRSKASFFKYDDYFNLIMGKKKYFYYHLKCIVDQLFCEDFMSSNIATLQKYFFEKFCTFNNALPENVTELNYNLANTVEENKLALENIKIDSVILKISVINLVICFFDYYIRYAFLNEKIAEASSKKYFTKQMMSDLFETFGRKYIIDILMEVSDEKNNKNIYMLYCEHKIIEKKIGIKLAKAMLKYEKYVVDMLKKISMEWKETRRGIDVEKLTSL